MTGAQSPRSAGLGPLAIKGYGSEGTWLVPSALRQLWPNREFPDVVMVAARAQSARWDTARFGPGGGGPAEVAEMIRRDAPLLRTLRSMPLIARQGLSEEEARATLAVLRGGPDGYRSLPLRTPTANQIASLAAGQPDALLDFSVADLMDIRGAGVISALDAITVFEEGISAVWESELIGSVAMRSPALAVSLPDPMPHIRSHLLDVLGADVADWAEQVHGDDPRFSDLLRRNTSVADLLADDATLPGLMRVAAEVAERVSRLQHMTVEEQLIDLLDSLLQGKLWRGFAQGSTWTRTLSARLGLDGPPTVTLAEAGLVHGVTRERVRQVESRLLSCVPAPGLWIPAVNRALTMVRESVPIIESDVGPMLAKAGLAGPAMTCQSLINATDMAKSSSANEITNQLRIIDGWVLGVDDRAAAQAGSVARRHTSKFGLTTLEDIAEDLSTAADQVAVAAIETVLRSSPEIRFTDDGWLWSEASDPESRHTNSLRNRVRSMLSVTSPLSVDSLIEGYRRSQRVRKRDVTPSHSAVRQFLTAHLDFIVEGDLVSSIAPLNYHAELGANQAAIVAMLRESPYGVMDRSSLNEAVAGIGISANSMSLWMTYASWIEKFGKKHLGSERHGSGTRGR